MGAAYATHPNFPRSGGRLHQNGHSETADFEPYQTVAVVRGLDEATGWGKLPLADATRRSPVRSRHIGIEVDGDVSLSRKLDDADLGRFGSSEARESGCVAFHSKQSTYLAHRRSNVFQR